VGALVAGEATQAAGPLIGGPQEESMSEKSYPGFRWLERGEGEPVVLLHGLMGRMDHWEGALEALADVCRPMALSLPIFDPRLPEVSVAELGRHVVRFLDALDIPRAVIGGNSLGGHVALEVALARPERVSGLILTGSSGLLERGVTRGVPRRPTAEYVKAKMEEVFYDPSFVTPACVESARHVLNTRSLAARVIRFAHASQRHRIEDRLGEIRAATLLVWGEDDRITPPALAERFCALIPDAQLWYLARCGHAPMLEHPRAFNQVLANWLGVTRSARCATAPVAGDAR
jgi:2-hydroxy-6-oxonona-2,4-dienedioate hydrolase